MRSKQIKRCRLNEVTVLISDQSSLCLCSESIILWNGADEGRMMQCSRQSLLLSAHPNTAGLTGGYLGYMSLSLSNSDQTETSCLGQELNVNSDNIWGNEKWCCDVFSVDWLLSFCHVLQNTGMPRWALRMNVLNEWMLWKPEVNNILLPFYDWASCFR